MSVIDEATAPLSPFSSRKQEARLGVDHFKFVSTQASLHDETGKNTSLQSLRVKHTLNCWCKGSETEHLCEALSTSAKKRTALTHPFLLALIPEPPKLREEVSLEPITK